jgi:hypothetical protein
VKGKYEGTWNITSRSVVNAVRYRKICSSKLEGIHVKRDEKIMKRYVNLALILSFIGLITGIFISSLAGYVCGIISIVLSVLHMKTDKKKCMIAITISTISLLLPLVMALALAISLDT